MLFLKKSGLCSHLKHLLAAIWAFEVLISVVNINKCMSQILFGKVAKWPGCVWQAWVVWILLMLMLKVAADFFFFFKGSEEISPQLKASIIKADAFSVFTL